VSWGDVACLCLCWGGCFGRRGCFFQKIFYVHTSFLLLLLFLCCISGVGGLVIVIVYVCMYVCICMCVYVCVYVLVRLIIVS